MDGPTCEATQPNLQCPSSFYGDCHCAWTHLGNSTFLCLAVLEDFKEPEESGGGRGSLLLSVLLPIIGIVLCCCCFAAHLYYKARELADDDGLSSFDDEEENDPEFQMRQKTWFLNTRSPKNRRRSSVEGGMRARRRSSEIGSGGGNFRGRRRSVELGESTSARRRRSSVGIMGMARAAGNFLRVPSFRKNGSTRSGGERSGGSNSLRASNSFRRNRPSPSHRRGSTVSISDSHQLPSPAGDPPSLHGSGRHFNNGGSFKSSSSNGSFRNGKGNGNGNGNGNGKRS